MIAFRAVATGRLSLLILTLIALPRVSRAEVPADGWVIWQSTRQEGRFEVYRARADGTEVKRMTTIGAGKAMWSPDGRWIAYQDQVNAVYLMRPDGSEQHNVSPPGIYDFWLHDNSGLVVNEGPQYFLLDPESGGKTPLFNQADFPQFGATTFLPNAMTNDNRYLLLGSHLYDNGYTGANGSFKSGFSAVMVDLLHKDKTYFIGNGCWPFTPPQGDMVFHICNDCPTHPDIYGMHLADLDTRSSYLPEEAHPDMDWGHEYNPRVSNDNNWVAYMSSTGCHEGLACDYEVFIHRRGAGPSERSRVTTDPSFDGYPDLRVGPLWKPQAEPVLFARPDRVALFALGTELPPARKVLIKNGGAGALAGVKATIDPPVPWLAMSGDQTSLTLEVKREGLVAGANRTTITVGADLVAPITIPVVVSADDTYPAPPDAGAPDAGAADAGVGDAGAASDATVSGDGPAASSDSGCSCALGAHGQGGWWLLALAALSARWARRRTRPASGAGRRRPGRG